MWVINLEQRSSCLSEKLDCPIVLGFWHETKQTLRDLFSFTSLLKILNQKKYFTGRKKGLENKMHPPE